MTSNRAIEAPFQRALIVATTLAGMAWMGNAYADNTSRTAAAAQTASVQSVASPYGERSFDLRDYGDRFKLAIEAIRKDSRKPDWTWDNSDDNGRFSIKD